MAYPSHCTGLLGFDVSSFLDSSGEVDWMPTDRKIATGACEAKFTLASARPKARKPAFCIVKQVPFCCAEFLMPTHGTGNL